MAKNLIICLDGTNNEFGDENTSIVRLFQCLDRAQSGEQAAYYDPGVGTWAPPGLYLKILQKLKYGIGLAFGFGVMENVEEAVRFLSYHYKTGDRIFIFGFSRGAYTARLLAGMLHKCGLPEAGAENLLPYFSKVYRVGNNHKVGGAFKETFGHPCPVHFLGLWDTVSSVGWAWEPESFPYTAKNPEVSIIRHAVALDERRAFFRTNLWSGEHPDKVEIWFPGVHSDIGGGYPPMDSDLWKISFQWMINEAQKAGLKLDEAKVVGFLGSQEGIPWHCGKMHESLKGKWKLAEFYPKRFWNRRATPPSYGCRLNLFRSRWVAPGALLHNSILARMQDVPEYRPSNLDPAFVARCLNYSREEIIPYAP
jgi:uncharacterized protein (DUF2235 family)